MRIAIVSVFDTACGIATYNTALNKELSKLAKVKIFAEFNGKSNTENIEYCWSRDKWPSFALIDAVDEFKPDIVLFSHEYGLFPKAYQFTSLVSYFKWRKYKVFCIFHSIYDHLDKTVQEACVPNILVHTEEGKECLINKGIKESSITVISHGSDFLTDDQTLLPPLWNTWSSNHTIFQPGFLFDYKGHSQMLDVIAKLKVKYSDVHYIVQASENPKCMNEHNQIYEKLMNKVKLLDLIPNVTFNRGFASMEVLLSFIRTVKCVVLPYFKNPIHEVRGCSGAARIILATETPLVTTNVHLFDDIKNVSLYSNSLEELEQNIEKVFSQKIDLNEMKAKRLEFLKKTHWSVIASQLFELFKK